MTYPKRLIEIDLPIKRISAYARPEKTTVHGNISTLHIWWARRPHAACRAVLCAALWPDPADPLCPDQFRHAAWQHLKAFAERAVSDKTLAASVSREVWPKWQSLSRANIPAPSKDTQWNPLRFLLLDFIADFSRWDNQAVRAYLDTARVITAAAHSVLGGEPGTKPFVFDPFAGGGTIPLQALRLGADAFASDLNPIAVLLNRVVLECVPRDSEQLKKRLNYWAEKIKAQAQAALADLYPEDPGGGMPLVYLWGRTICCEGPGCGFTVPLIRTLDLGGGQRLCLVPDKVRKVFKVTIATSGGGHGTPTVKGGSVSCPAPGCGYTTLAKAVRAQLLKKRGGSKDAQLLAVLVERNGERRFRSPNARDLDAVARATVKRPAELPDAEINPIRPHKNTRGLSAVTRIGMQKFQDLYSERQLRSLEAFSDALRSAIGKSGADSLDRDALTILGLCFGRLLQQNSTCARWRNGAYAPAGSFGKQALQVVWDFAEITPLSSAAGSWDGAVEWARKIIELNRVVSGEGTVTRSAAQECPLPADSASLLFTDPPYFAAIPYSDLANFFYVWERRYFRELYPDLFSCPVIDQTQEIIVTDANLGLNGIRKGALFP